MITSYNLESKTTEECFRYGGDKNFPDASSFSCQFFMQGAISVIFQCLNIDNIRNKIACICHHLRIILSFKGSSRLYKRANIMVYCLVHCQEGAWCPTKDGINKISLRPCQTCLGLLKEQHVMKSFTRYSAILAISVNVIIPVPNISL